MIDADAIGPPPTAITCQRNVSDPSAFAGTSNRISNAIDAAGPSEGASLQFSRCDSFTPPSYRTIGSQILNVGKLLGGASVGSGCPPSDSMYEGHGSSASAVLVRFVSVRT